MRLIAGIIVFTILTTYFGVAYGGSKKNPNIPRSREINRGRTTNDDSGDNGGNSIDDTSRHFSTSSASNETRMWTPLQDSGPPETIVARKIPQGEWSKETSLRVIQVKEPEFFYALIEPRSNAFVNFRWDGLDAGAMVDLVNSTNAVISSDNATIPPTTVEPMNKRNAGTPTLASINANLGIYLVTGVLASVCIVGLFVIFCVARSNGQRARDYEFNNRRAGRQGGNTPAAAGWRRSQDYLNEAGGFVEERGDRNPAMAMKRMESDVTDV